MAHPSTHYQSRRLALCSLMTALSLVILLLGGIVPLATFACPMLAMLCLLPILREWGWRWCIGVYVVSAFLALLLAPDKEMALFYTFLGFYPALRPRLNHLRNRFLRVIVKCGIFSFSMILLYLLILYLFRLEAVVEELGSLSLWALAGLLALGNVTFLIFDLLLARMSLLYEHVLRRRIFR